MGFPLIFLRKVFLRKIAFLVLGFLLGSAGTIASIGLQVDELTNAKEILEEELSATQAELAQIRDSLSQHQEPVVTSLAIKIEFTDLKLLRLEEDTIRLGIEKQIKEILKNLMGKKLKDLDPSLIPLIVENRLIEIEGHTFKVKVKLLVITEKIYITLQAQNIVK